MVLTDVIKRWNVLRGKNAILCTGTDEHGLKVVSPIDYCERADSVKVQRAAAKAGVDPKAFCDKGADIFRVRKSIPRPYSI
jgi:methionyl-tRNA synthetase